MIRPREHRPLVLGKKHSVVQRDFFDMQGKEPRTLGTHGFASDKDRVRLKLLDQDKPVGRHLKKRLIPLKILFFSPFSRASRQDSFLFCSDLCSLAVTLYVDEGLF